MSTKNNKLKGSAKQAVILTNPNSPMYEQAIFILKHDQSIVVGDGEILQEAERIIRENSFPVLLSRRRLPHNWVPILTISITISLLVGISVLLFVLL